MPSNTLSSSKSQKLSSTPSLLTVPSAFGISGLGGGVGSPPLQHSSDDEDDGTSVVVLEVSPRIIEEVQAVKKEDGVRHLIERKYKAPPESYCQQLQDIGSYLIPALAEIATKRPLDPIEYLALWLKKRRDYESMS